MTICVPVCLNTPTESVSESPSFSSEATLFPLLRPARHEAPRQERAPHVAQVEAVTPPDSASPGTGLVGRNPAKTSDGAARPLTPSLTDTTAQSQPVNGLHVPASGNVLSSGTTAPSTDPTDADSPDDTFAELPNDSETPSERSAEGSWESRGDTDSSETRTTARGPEEVGFGLSS